MKLPRRTKPDAAEWKRIKAQLAAGVPIKWIAQQHQINAERIREMKKREA